MRRFFVIISILLSMGVYAQTDSTINRVVTVEREFQPVIQDAGKINQRPLILQHDLQLNPVVYSTYSAPLSIGHNVHPLQVAKTDFTPQAPLNGVLEGAVGYRNTHLLFGYQLHKKKNDLNLYANHNAYWGKDALSQSDVGMLLTHHFQTADLYFGLEGQCETYQYQPLFNMSTLGNANTRIGIVSTHTKPLQYRIQTGYKAFITSIAIEHQVNSHFDISWTNQHHDAGVKASVQNRFYSPVYQRMSASPSHAIRIEPFYEYNNKSIHVHAGINLDMNIGTGKMLSNIEDLSFAPSPNVQFAWHTTNNIFHLYANAIGCLGLGSVEEYMGYNRYLNLRDGLAWKSPRVYTPVDAQIGFKLLPTKTILIDIYGGYAYLKNACNMQAVCQEDMLNYQLWLDDYQRWRVGANIHYHYRDILEINLGGNYYFYQQEPIPSMDPESPHFQEIHLRGTHIFDRPNWDAYARVEAHIDSKWSIYTENYFTGSRFAYVQYYSDGASVVALKPIISLNIGGQYIINRWLSVYLQLDDYLNRKDEIFYGFQSQGIHFLAGVKWKF